jgi:hypothetical protein
VFLTRLFYVAGTEFPLRSVCTERTAILFVPRSKNQGSLREIAGFMPQGSLFPLRLGAVSQKLLRDQTVKLGSCPAGFHEQRSHCWNKSGR